MIIKVKCPKCGYVQTTTTVKRVKCHNCGHVYKVFYKTRYKNTWSLRSRVVDIVEGSREELMREVNKILIKKRR